MGIRNANELEARRLRALLNRLEAGTATNPEAHGHCGVPGCVHQAEDTGKPAMAA